MTPFLIMSCSATKKATGAPVPFTELYDGPVWQQLKKASYPADRIGVVSALHGYLAPGEAIADYDCKMDEDRLMAFVNDRKVMDKLAAAIEANELTVVVGGETYKLLSLVILARYPHLIGKVRFVCGSFLQQRKAVSALTQAVADAAADAAAPLPLAA